jgi:hypothetical protein
MYDRSQSGDMENRLAGATVELLASNGDTLASAFLAEFYEFPFNGIRGVSAVKISNVSSGYVV